MIWKRVILSWMTLLALMFASAGATAAPDASPKPHVGVIDLAAAVCIEASGLASADEHRGNPSAATTGTSDVSHAARGVPKSAGVAARKGSFTPSPNQLNKAIKRGQAPRGLERVDVGKVKGEQVHVHFENGAALNIDGTCKHGSANVTNAQMKWLRGQGWTPPTP